MDGCTVCLFLWYSKKTCPSNNELCSSLKSEWGKKIIKYNFWEIVSQGCLYLLIGPGANFSTSTNRSACIFFCFSVILQFTDYTFHKPLVDDFFE